MKSNKYIFLIIFAFLGIILHFVIINNDHIDKVLNDRTEYLLKLKPVNKKIEVRPINSFFDYTNDSFFNYRESGEIKLSSLI